MISDQTLLTLIYGGYLATAIGSSLLCYRELQELWRTGLAPIGVLMFAPVVMRLTAPSPAGRHPASHNHRIPVLGRAGYEPEGIDLDPTGLNDEDDRDDSYRFNR